MATHGKRGVPLSAGGPQLGTDLAKRLWAIRQRVIAGGEPLLSWDEIERELAARRGDVDISPG